MELLQIMRSGLTLPTLTLVGVMERTTAAMLIGPIFRPSRGRDNRHASRRGLRPRRRRWSRLHFSWLPIDRCYCRLEQWFDGTCLKSRMITPA